MKFSIRKRVVLDLEMDSSECIMFCRGGQQNIRIPKEAMQALLDESKQIKYYEDDANKEYLDTHTEYYIAIQLGDKGKFDWITSEALKHKESVKNES